MRNIVLNVEPNWIGVTMSDLIKRQDAIEACRSVADNINRPTDQQIGAEYCLDLIKEIPSVEPERKTGEWWNVSESRTGDGYWFCSECGFSSEAFGANILYKFCPNCGAKMEQR